MRRTGVLAWLLSTTIPAAAVPPIVDGFLDDPFWCTDARVWNTYRRDAANDSARFYLGFDDRFVYFAADVTDRDLTGTRDRGSERVTDDDAVQLFLDVGDNLAVDYVPDVFEYSFSVAGGTWWSHHNNGGNAASAPAETDEQESSVSSAVTLKPNSTLNQHGDRDTGYVVEAAISWSQLGRQWPLPQGRTVGVCFVNLVRPEEPAHSSTRPVDTPISEALKPGLPQLWQRFRPTAGQDSLEIRGTTMSLPLWLGTSMYDNAWQRFAKAETDPAGAWFNRKQWHSKLEKMASLKLNALLLLHPHPFPGFLALDKHRGACYFPADQLARHQEQFRWLLSEARKRGIAVYLLTWNVCLPPTWAKSHDMSELGSDTPLAREYTRDAVTELMENYPDLGGIATMAGENPPGCVDFVVEAIAKPMAVRRASMSSRPASGPARDSPELIFWSWCSYPEDARRVMAACPNTRLMHYLQYEQWFKPMVDPRAARFETWATASPLNSPNEHSGTVTLGGPKSSLGYLFWGDPEWLRLLSVDLRRQGTTGVFFEPYCAENWLAQEAMAYYCVNREDRFLSERWTRRLDDVYGVSDHAPALLEAMQHASAITPKFLTLVHSQSDHYMPQFGLPLTHYLEMPTLSSYVFENTQTTDDRGYLTPRLGLAWPNPDWGERVSSIREEVNGTAPAGSTLPSDIGREIELHVSTCRLRIEAMKHAKPPYPEQAERFARLLDYLELNVSLGEHFANKIRAALAWQRLVNGRGQAAECVEPLEKSVRAWEGISDITGRLYPQPVRYWQSQIVSPPPWTQNQIWSSYHLVKGHWRDQLPRLRRELAMIRDGLSLQPPHMQLPLWDHLDAEPEQELISLGRIGFQLDADRDRRFRIKDGARITKPPTAAKNEPQALVADTRGLSAGPHEVLVTDSKLVPMPGGRPYQIALAYRVIDRGGPEATPFEIGVRPEGGGQPIGEHRFWGAPNGYAGVRVLKVPAVSDRNCVFSIIIHGQAAIVINLIDIRTRKAY